MQVFVKVRGAESFPVHTVRTRAELERILDFARIGSQTGEPRNVYKIVAGRRMLIARYENGQSRTTKVMRARRSPLFGIAGALAVAALKRGLFG